MGGHIRFDRAEAWLTAYRAVWLATTGLDGSPHVAPVWFLWDGDRKAVYFATGEKAVKVKNLAHQPRVVLNLGDGDDTLIMKGRAIQVHDTDERSKFEQAFGDKYTDPHSGARANLAYMGGLLYRVDIEHMMIWEYGIVSTRTDWHF